MLGDVRRLFAIVAVLAGASGCAGGGAPEAKATPARSAASSAPPEGAALPPRAAAEGARDGADEIRNLERLWEATPTDSPDHPALLRRLAEKYVELEVASYKARIEAEEKRDAVTARKLEATLASAREQAIKYYKLLKDQHPNYCLKEGSGCTDEVLYYLAYEYEQANRLDDARKTYYELIKNWPTSKFIPNAYLAFAERFFEQAAGDPSLWKPAEEAYHAVLRFPPPDNKVWGYAKYKLGFVYWNTGDFPKALNEMKGAIEFGMQSKEPSAARLTETARRDLTSIYALAGDPGKAFDFFRPLSGDGAGEQQKTLKMMNELGQRYLDAGNNKSAVVVYIDLIRRSQGAPPCALLSQIDRATAPDSRPILDQNRALLDRARAGCAP